MDDSRSAIIDDLDRAAALLTAVRFVSGNSGLPDAARRIQGIIGELDAIALAVIDTRYGCCEHCESMPGHSCTSGHTQPCRSVGCIDGTRAA